MYRPERGLGDLSDSASTLSFLESWEVACVESWYPTVVVQIAYENLCFARDPCACGHDAGCILFCCMRGIENARRRARIEDIGYSWHLERSPRRGGFHYPAGDYGWEYSRGRA